MKEEKYKFIEEGLLIFSKNLFKIFLNQKDPASMMSLFILRHYRAKEGDFNTGVEDVMLALKWDREKVEKTIKEMQELGTIACYHDDEHF